jgi:hypothetical protein
MQESLRPVPLQHEGLSMDSMAISGYDLSIGSRIQQLESEICTLRRLVTELLAKNQKLRMPPFAFGESDYSH